jgi:hypothetical protein
MLRKIIKKEINIIIMDMMIKMEIILLLLGIILDIDMKLLISLVKGLLVQLLLVLIIWKRRK